MMTIIKLRLPKAKLLKRKTQFSLGFSNQTKTKIKNQKSKLNLKLEPNSNDAQNQNKQFENLV